MNPYDKIKLENQVCFPLYALSREVIKLYKPLLDPFHLTYTQYVTMLVVWEVEKIGFKELGHRLHLDSGTLTPVLKKLEAMKLIIKYRTKEDDRVVMVEIAEKGRKMRDDILQVPDQMVQQFSGDKRKLLAFKQLLDELLASTIDN